MDDINDALEKLSFENPTTAWYKEYAENGYDSISFTIQYFEFLTDLERFEEANKVMEKIIDKYDGLKIKCKGLKDCALTSDVAARKSLFHALDALKQPGMSAGSEQRRDNNYLSKRFENILYLINQEADPDSDWDGTIPISLATLFVKLMIRTRDKLGLLDKITEAEKVKIEEHISAAKTRVRLA